jgi:hypothetical protein
MSTSLCPHKGVTLLQCVLHAHNVEDLTREHFYVPEGHKPGGCRRLHDKELQSCMLHQILLG